VLKLTAYAGIHDPDDHVSRENFDNDLGHRFRDSDGGLAVANLLGCGPDDLARKLDCL